MERFTVAAADTAAPNFVPLDAAYAQLETTSQASANRCSPITELSQVLGGMKIPAPITAGRLLVWRDHAEKCEAAFRQFASCYAEPVSRWSDRNLVGFRAADTVFYPFSGPDILFPLLLWPDAQNYILCGLEPCGVLPDAAAPERELLAASVQILAIASHFLKFSYYITSDMRAQMHAGALIGILPVLLTFLARAGAGVSSVAPIFLEGSGDQPISVRSIRGVRVGFQMSGSERQLFYFHQDLRDGRFDRDNALFRLVCSFDSPVALLKCASYLAHEPHFTTVRDLILAHCVAVVQDPSGLPYRLLLQRGWTVALHGRYSGSLPVFDKYSQPDLIDAYRSGDSRPLGFGFGYSGDPKRAGIMIAAPGRCASSYVDWPVPQSAI